MQTVRFMAGVVVSAALLTGCAGSPAPTATSTVTVKETTSAPSSASTPPLAPPMSATPPAPVAAGPWTMPNLIGQDLQAAQNAIQALTDYKVFFSGSTDLTGKGRMQINDRNWQVCTSTPPPGSTITEQTSVEFGVVKDSETCP